MSPAWDENLSPLEKELINAIRAGKQWEPEDGSALQIVDEPDPSAWGDERCVNAGLLRRLLLTPAGKGLLAGVSPDWTPTIKLVGVRVNGELNLSRNTVNSWLDMEGCWLDISEAFGLDAAIVPGMTLKGCWLTNGVSGRGLTVLHRLEFESCCIGPVILSGGRINGQFSLRGTKLRNATNVALDAEAFQVGGTAMLDEGFDAEGEVRISAAAIGRLVMSGAQLRNPNGLALNARGLRVEETVLLDHGFDAIGEVRISGAHFTRLRMTDATLRNSTDVALNAEALEVDGTALLAEGFAAEGTVRLDRARCATLSFDGAKLHNEHDLALDATALHVERIFAWEPLEVTGNVSFELAEIGDWWDNGVARKQSSLLDGLRYQRLRPRYPYVSFRERIQWLRGNPTHYSPQPFSQLATSYKTDGLDGFARKTFVKSQTTRLQRYPKWHPIRIIGVAFDLTVGYGYVPWRALYWLVALTIAGGIAIQHVHRDFSPTTGAPPFNAFFYTVDMLLPVVDLGYNKWRASGAGQIITVALIVVGWALVTAILAGLASVLRRGD
jgi:hypothetical protein